MATVAMLLAACVGAACVGGPAQPVKSGGEEDHWVRDIRLSSSRGEVNSPFSAEVTYETNFLRDPEWELTGLPAGLVFDADKRRITGVPKQPGFFTVNVAVRKRAPRDDPRHRPRPDERWWPATFELEIYTAPK
jgi:hypothetical protein